MPGMVHTTISAKKMPPRFSILLPTHNRPDVLRFAIESVLHQTEDDFEVLVVGDGCTDSTAELVSSFNDDRLRWFDLPKAPNFGSANRNIALHEARGELIAFLGHDDLWLPDHLEQLGACFDDGAIELAYSLPLWVLPDGFIVPIPFNLHDPEILDDFAALRRNSIAAGCFVHRRSCLAKYGYWNENLPNAADIDLWSRIILGGGRKNFRYLYVPTCMHFRASWRTELTAGPTELQTWQVLRQHLGGVAEQLQVDVTGHVTEQEAVWTEMKRDLVGWVARLRSLVTQALDRRYLEADRHMHALAMEAQRSDADRWNARAALRKAGIPLPAATYRLSFGPGFYPDEGGFRWISREAALLIVFESRLLNVCIDCRCSTDKYYDVFPFSITIEVDGSHAETLRFVVPHQSHRLVLTPQRADMRIRFRCEAAFAPAQAGISDDTRELSVQITNIEAVDPSQALASAASGEGCADEWLPRLMKKLRWLQS